MNSKFFKVLSVIVVLSFISALFIPLNTEAKAEERTIVGEMLDGTSDFMMPVYVGQANTLALATQNGVAKPSKVKWKVTGGTGKIKIDKKKNTYKGIKAGTVYVTAKYNKESYDFVVEVLKKKSLKARTVTSQGISYKIPANYDLFADPLYINTKKETGLILQGLDFGVDLSTLDSSVWDEFEKELINGLNTLDISTFDTYGIGIDNSKVKRNIETVERGLYVATFECPVKNIGTYYYKMATILSGSTQKCAVFYSLNEDDITDDFEYFIKKNR